MTLNHNCDCSNEAVTGIAANKKLGAVLIALSDCYKAFKQKTPE